MSAILSITAPIFILIALGYVCVMTGLTSRDTTRGMGIFVITIALPALIISGMANKPLTESMDIDFLGGYSVASLIVFALGMVLYRQFRKGTLAENSMAGLGVASSNSGFIGVSICTMALGTEIASRAVAMTILVESTLMLPMAMAIADASGRQGDMTARRRLLNTLKQLCRSPLLIAIMIGLVLAGFRIPLPAVPLRVIEMLAMAAAPVALFAVGGNLYGLRPKGMLADAAAISLGKLIIHPAVTAVVFLLFPRLDPAMRQAGVIFAAAPMLSIFPIIGMRYGLEDRCSAALLLATGLSFITVSATIALVS
jgi:Predicted permeases